MNASRRVGIFAVTESDGQLSVQRSGAWLALERILWLIFVPLIGVLLAVVGLGNAADAARRAAAGGPLSVLLVSAVLLLGLATTALLVVFWTKNAWGRSDCVFDRVGNRHLDRGSYVCAVTEIRDVQVGHTHGEDTFWNLGVTYRTADGNDRWHNIYGFESSNLADLGAAIGSFLGVAFFDNP